MPVVRKSARVQSAAIPAEALEQSFPELDLPLEPPYPPAEAKSVKEVPRGAEWLYEPKWDGFRCLAFRNGDEVVLQSKAGQPLTRYFPEIVEALRSLPARRFVLDGEIVVASPNGYDNAGNHGVALDFDALLQRIHPAASRIQRLSHETPATYMLFDLLMDERGEPLVDQRLSDRRDRLHNFVERCLTRQNAPGSPDQGSRIAPSFAQSGMADCAGFARAGVDVRLKLSPATRDLATAEKWMREGATSGWDGIVAKRLDCEYTSGERTGMVKVKRIRTADCVIGGFRWLREVAKKSAAETAKNSATRGKAAQAKSVPIAKRKPGRQVGSLLLGLYNDRGELDHVGFSSSFSREDRKKLKSILQPLIAGPPRNSGEHQGSGGFTGKAPGGPSRWTRDDRDTEWVPLKPRLVGEFQYDHFSGGRFRHGTKFLRWRPDKKPRQCTMDQLRPGGLKAA
jgi:ATP-dependent DNA ligase